MHTTPISADSAAMPHRLVLIAPLRNPTSAVPGEGVVPGEVTNGEDYRERLQTLYAHWDSQWATQGSDEHLAKSEVTSADD
jgi:hypothetical protein